MQLRRIFTVKEVRKIENILLLIIYTEYFGVEPFWPETILSRDLIRFMCWLGCLNRFIPRTNQRYLSALCLLQKHERSVMPNRFRSSKLLLLYFTFSSVSSLSLFPGKRYPEVIQHEFLFVRHFPEWVFVWKYKFSSLIKHSDHLLALAALELERLLRQMYEGPFSTRYGIAAYLLKFLSREDAHGNSCYISKWRWSWQEISLYRREFYLPFDKGFLAECVSGQKWGGEC